MSGLEMRYFILKPKGIDEYARASREAMWAYANAIEGENLEMTRLMRKMKPKFEGKTEADFTTKEDKKSSEDLLATACAANVSKDKVCCDCIREYQDKNKSKEVRRAKILKSKKIR